MSLFDRFSRAVALIALCVVGVLATARLSAQAPVHAAAQIPIFDATDLLQPTSFGDGWLVEAGDNPEWADPNYDDSQWHRFNAKTDSLHTLYPEQAPEVVWYRLHLKVAPRDTSLALEEWLIGSAFEIYSNGVKILSVGSVKPFSAYDAGARLLTAIPRDQTASGSVVLVIRTRISRSEWVGAYPGLYYQNIVLGQEEALREHIWLNVIGRSALLQLDGLLILAMIVGAVLLYSAQRRMEYLFLTLALSAALLTEPMELYGAFHVFPEWWHLLALLSLLLVPYLWARTYLAFIAKPVGWRMQTFLVFVSVSSCVEGALEMTNISSATTQIVCFLPFVALFGVALPAILIGAMRRGDRHAGILLVPMLLTVSEEVARLIVIGLEQIPALRATAYTVTGWLYSQTAGPFAIPLDVVAGILSVLSLALIVLLRSNRQSREKAMLDGEMASAREVQQVILPDAVETVPGFRVESVYEPAQEVGGDFFQTIADGAGGITVVVGDVSGKGLPAAMLVSMLVGATRSVAESTWAPDVILAHLNRRLTGRARGGFSTAIAAHISASGVVTMANAGHLAPYLDGHELELPGALPLGIDAQAVYETHTFTLAVGNRLVLYSDGVVEAQNTRGELLGFKRAAELSTKQVTEIAAAAKDFGQSDDITVVAITWQGTLTQHESVATGGIRERSAYPSSI